MSSRINLEYGSGSQTGNSFDVILSFSLFSRPGDGGEKGRMKKRGTPPMTLTKKGTLLFTAFEIFDIHVVVGISPTAQHDVCSSTVHDSLYMDHHRCLRTA